MLVDETEKKNLRKEKKNQARYRVNLIKSG